MLQSSSTYPYLGFILKEAKLYLPSWKVLVLHHTGLCIQDPKSLSLRQISLCELWRLHSLSQQLHKFEDICCCSVQLVNTAESLDVNELTNAEGLSG